MHSNDELETIAARLEESGDYRVLRRLRERDLFRDDDGTQKRIGLILDAETTGLDPTRDEIIELAMLKFEYGLDGGVFRVLDQFSRLREPTIAIPIEITKLTGITGEMVAGKIITTDEVEHFSGSAAVVIAHNAGFDRRFVERAFPVFNTKPWACSMSQVDWEQEGFDGTRLGYLLGGCGLFHDGHRADEDCRALLEILSRPLPSTGEVALKRLLDTARKPMMRVWAENAPFDFKDILKARGYRWNDGSDSRPRSWWKDLHPEALDGELTYLRAEIFQYQADISVRRVTAVDRFSDRA
jgi:DNA polymerase-3 subunit epsilon